MTGGGAESPGGVEALEARAYRYAQGLAVLCFTAAAVLLAAAGVLYHQGVISGLLALGGGAAGVYWLMSQVGAANRRAELRLCRDLVAAGHYEPAVARLKALREADDVKDEAAWLVARAYDRQGARKLALASYREYLARFDDAREDVDTRGVWVVEAQVRVEELEQQQDAASAVEVRAQQAPAKPELRCPFCREDFQAEALTAECADCGTPHHLACYEEQGGCAVYGCRSHKVKAKVKE